MTLPWKSCTKAEGVYIVVHNIAFDFQILGTVFFNLKRNSSEYSKWKNTEFLGRKTVAETEVLITDRAESINAEKIRPIRDNLVRH